MMARRFWVKRRSGDEVVVHAYFSSEGQAQAVADGLNRETTGNSEYYVKG